MQILLEGQTDSDLQLSRKRMIQYAAASRVYHCRLWNTGSPGPVSAKASTRPRIHSARRSFGEGGKPGDDSGACVRILAARFTRGFQIRFAP
jgi:hypothetical protein